MFDKTVPSVQPLVGGIQRVREIVDTSPYSPDELDGREQDYEVLREMLSQIEEACETAREEYLRNIRAAQNENLWRLRETQ